MEYLAYNQLAGAKYDMLGMSYPLQHIAAHHIAGQHLDPSHLHEGNGNHNQEEQACIK